MGTEGTLERGGTRWVLIVGFLCCLLAPLGALVVGSEQQVSAKEKRRLAPRPAVPRSWVEVRQVPARFDAWFRDHLGLRESLIRWNSRVKVLGFAVSPVSEIVVGRQGWLFNARENALDQYRGTNPLSGETLRRITRTIQSRATWLAQRGIEFLVVVAPNKHTIYPEFMPRRIHRVRADSHLDQLIADLRARGGPAILDLREPLRQGKAVERLYHRTDTHWNDLGAYLAYQEVLGRLSSTFPHLHPAPRSAFEFRRIDRPGGGLSLGLRLTEVLREESLELHLREPRSRRQARTPVWIEGEWREFGIGWGVGDAALPRAVIFRDSFADALIPFLSEHFERVVFVREWDPRLVRQESPDLVILELVERRLPQLSQVRRPGRRAPE